MADQLWKVSVYRDDSVTTVVYENVKHVFWTAGETILTIAQYAEDGSHHYINWKREAFIWYKIARQGETEHERNERIRSTLAYPGSDT